MLFDEKNVSEYCSTWGSPLYVFDEDSFISNYRHFDTCFKNIYEKYKYKWNNEDI